MPVHLATADANEERRALGQRLRFSNSGYDEGGSYGNIIENIIPYVNWGAFDRTEEMRQVRDGSRWHLGLDRLP